ncbi:MAG: 30S ribosomal protein S9 [Deltaproteobacteria bacterium]|nr:30S ribosomal protein S9 [Deltaproteobacteria bacterium]
MSNTKVNGQRVNATGRRKEASARVFLTPGSGKVTINRRESDEYFRRATLLMIINQPFQVTETEGKWDVWATVSGGGLSGQAEAVKHGISRALAAVSVETHRPALKRSGFLTRDARVVERKKYGRPGARKRFQFSKR